ncbi:MAG: zinc ribbon domain-containing protein [Burkholderiaceae bacterium]|nr:zinc ribbon domain-containing protein [Burkholderiaceae bacterium]
MPIYAYRCDSCGVEKDVLQKLSDAPLTVCPECGAEAFHKRLSAPAFQLKGSGWYVTDFRDGGKKGTPDAKPGGANGDGKAEADSKKPAPAAGPAASPAPAPASPAPASAPAGAAAPAPTAGTKPD